MPMTGLPEAERAGGSTEELILTPELVETFLVFLAEKGRSGETVQSYRRRLEQLRQWLPEDKQIRRGTLEGWRKAMLEQGYAPRTVNQGVSAANSLLEACGRRELQVSRPLAAGKKPQPELTRGEYLRLLSTARNLGKEREYLLVKVFATMGLNVRDLPWLTVEAVRAGKVTFPDVVAHIPGCLREELLDYTGRQGTETGPVFVTQSGRPCNRTGVTGLIRRLCRDAQVPEEKANPRCLRKLYLATRADIQDNIALLVEQSHERLLETEQLVIGWKEGTAPAGPAPGHRRPN